MKIINDRYVVININGNVIQATADTPKSIHIGNHEYKDFPFGKTKIDERPWCLEHNCLLQACRYEHDVID